MPTDYIWARDDKEENELMECHDSDDVCIEEREENVESFTKFV